MLFFLLCALAIITVYCYTYIILGKNIKSRNLISIIPASINAIVFIWLILDKRFIPVTYILYGLAVIVIFTYVIHLFIKKNILKPILILIPSSISIYILFWFIEKTYLNPVPCDIADGCMNETGMFLVICYFLMGISFLLAVISYFSQKRPMDKSN